MAEASGTHGPARAPGGLGFVQDVVNTRYVGPARPYDPFADLDRARPWLDEALRLRALDLGPVGPVLLEERDLGRLRELRDTLAAVITDPSSAALPWQGPAVGARFGADGILRLEPQGDGYKRVAGLVAVDVFVAQQARTWSRLKTCRGDHCSIAFFDRSPNSSAIWHDAKACGNAPNLRASRARRRTNPGQGPQSH